MFKIGEFSKMVRVSSRMLRYYEQCGLLYPDKVDSFTGYRLYSAAQIPVLYRIVELRDMGFGVEEIKKILPRMADANFLYDMLDRKRKEIQDTIAGEQDKLNKIAAKCGHISKERVHMIYEVEIKALKAEKVLSLRENIPAYEAEYVLWEKIKKFMAENNVICEGNGYSIYHDNAYREEDVDVEIALPVHKTGENQDSFKYKELPAIPQAATIRFSGSYSGYNSAIEKLAGWIEKNGYTINGLIRGLAVKSFADVASEDDLLTEIQVSVEKA